MARCTSIWTTVAVSTAAAFVAVAPATAADAVDYVRDVRPIFKAHCYKCHGPDRQKSELRLDTAKSMLEGGAIGPAIVPGKSKDSLLIQAVLGTSDDVVSMPPEGEGEPLSAQQIALVRLWIDEGAKHPADEKPEPAAEKRRDHWAFRPVVRPAVPTVKDPTRIANPIDAFVAARLDKENLTPSPEADRPTLIRRLSLDLIGLPPSPDQVDAFVADSRPDAYERLVDRLLASPHYGERWGRHWLDQARYADSNGYTNDEPRVMWKYRDWVIDAVNRGMPFDQFVIEQLAGDLLPGATLDQVLATGFHRNTQFNSEGGSDPEQYRVEAVIDRVATTGSVLLGLTLGCARCHDHKFDPISQQEFYQLFAFFNQQDEPQVSVPLAGHGGEPWTAVLRQLPIGDNKPAKTAKKDKSVKASKKKPASGSKPEAVKPESAKPETAKPETAKPDVAQPNANQPVADRLDATNSDAAVDAPPQATTTLATTTALVMRERAKPRETYVHIRGDFLRKGRTVAAGAPESLPPLRVGEGKSLNRLHLARWLVSRDHPLTPRVTVNRMWQCFFGRGLVETENDFGAQGTPPSHPELLDWLASEFVASGWDAKRVHRLIVTSATYRQSSHVRPDLKGADPTNRLLARQNRVRLEAEVIRDAALDAAGLLSPKMKGPSVFPPQPDGVMKLTRTPGRTWSTSGGEDRFRRGLYTYFWRSTPHPFLKLFNAPESNATCTRRDRSNTPLQALTMLNDEMFAEAAAGLAARLMRETPLETSTPSGERSIEGQRIERQRIELAFRLCLGRSPRPLEVEALLQLVRADSNGKSANETPPHSARPTPPPDGMKPHDVAAWTNAARALLNLDEFITRE